MTESTPTNLGPAQPTPYASAVLDFLAEEGFCPSLDGEGDVMFKFQGGRYSLVTSGDDATCFALSYLRFWSLDDASERLRAHEATALTHRRIRVGRVTLLDDDVNACVEDDLPDVDSWRSVSGLPALVNTFCEHLHAQLEN